MSTKRHFDNPFDDYCVENTVFQPNSCQLNDKTKALLSEGFRNLLNHLEANIDKSINSNDYSVYTGSTGFANLYLHLSQILKDNNLLDKCLSLTDPIIKNLKPKRDDISFLLGDSGVLSIGAVVHHLKGDQNGSEKLLNSLKSMIVFTTDINSQLPDELLYGRSGFLYSLLFLRKLIPNSNQIISNNDIRGVVDAILRSGQKTAKKSRLSECPLMYFWYKTPYVGAAHGLIGIMALLLEAKQYLTDEELNTLVKPTIDFILSIRLTSGNFPSGLDDFNDVLVHWCHGSPGALHMLCLAYQTFRDERYLRAAEACCQCIWKRGLLKKGYGLCHGAAGNGYAFLRLYQLTDDPKQLYRAVKFGEWCSHYGQHGCRTPDTPFSLFEGMAGTVYYLSDLMNPKNSRFPAYQLS